MTGKTQLRVAVATPLTAELAGEIVQREPRIELIFEPDLLPEARYPGDHVGDPDFNRSAADSARFHAILDSADALYGVPDEKPAELRRTADANPRLRWVHTMPAGGGGQLRAAQLSFDQLQRIIVSTSAGVHAEPLAEFAIFGLLSGAKSLTRLSALKGRREWPDRWTMPLLSEQRVLVVGLGNIGKAVARKAHALGASVSGVSRRPRDIPEVGEVFIPEELPDRVGEFDAIVVTLPGTDKTRHLLGESVLSRVRPGSTIVNVGRGSVIDEKALTRALDEGRIGLAALDVFEHEPLDRESPLWSHPAALISPHTAGLTHAEDILIARLFAENATRLLDGRELRNRVNTDEFY